MRYALLISICLAGAGLIALPMIHESIVAANAYYALGMRHGQVPESVPAYTRAEWAHVPTFAIGCLTLIIGMSLVAHELLANRRDALDRNRRSP